MNVRRLGRLGLLPSAGRLDRALHPPYDFHISEIACPLVETPRWGVSRSPGYHSRFATPPRPPPYTHPSCPNACQVIPSPKTVMNSALPAGINSTNRLRTGKRILYLQEQLIAAREALRERATRDAVTGLWNRSAVLELLANELARQKRHGGTVAVVMIDLDRFKHINDEFGHLVGDQVLRLVARGMPNKQISRELGIAQSTVKSHVGSIFGKLGLLSRTQVALYAARTGLVALELQGAVAG